MNMSLARFLFLLAIGAAEAIAAPITYTITFTTESPSEIAPDSGGFTYDSAAALGNQFSNFLVRWDGVTWDLTDPANFGAGAPPFCGTSQDSATSFAMLTTGICTPVNFLEWDAHVEVGGVTANKFRFVDARTPDLFFGTAIEAVTYTGTPIISPADASGTWRVTPVPEPSTIFLLIAGGAILMGGKRKGYRTLPAN